MSFFVSPGNALLELKSNASLTFTCVAISILTVSAVQYFQAWKRDIAVPAIGPSGRLTSYYGAIMLLKNAKEMLEEGYSKYNMCTFKIPLLERWLVVVNSPELIDEIRKAPDDKLSFIEAIEENLAVKYTMGPLISGNHYHVAIVRSQLTRNLGVLFNDIQDEVAQAFEDNIPVKSDEWVSLPALSTVMQVVCRTSNRLFIGLPLCRDKDFIDLNIRFTLDVIKGSKAVNMFPDFLKKFVGEILTSVPASTRRGIKHLRPIIEYRLSQIEKDGKDWPGKPNDMLSWLIDDAPENERRNVKALTQRILTLNFAAVHTSSISFTHALFHLASRPQDIEPLREEVERVIKDEGWSKTSLQKMRKIDSFVREGQRYNGIGLLSMTRKALVDYTLSDGTFLPAGTHVACNAVSTHYDERNYENAREFDGFRFANLSEESTGEDSRYQMVSTSVDFLPFGHGRHACPGRFFAANELKTMLAYLVLNYDMKIGGSGERPKDLYFGTASVANPTAHVLFRKRKIW